jgi:hypothetical protein
MVGIFGYEEAEQFYEPPRAIFDDEGKPLLSWRVLILPYIDQKDLYQQFHLDEPWDSPHNKPLIAKMPSIFQDPLIKTDSGFTVFHAVVGSGLGFEQKGRYKGTDISDGRSLTISLVEVAPENAVPWTKPADWEYNAEHPMKGLADVGPVGLFKVAFFDGHVDTLKRTCDPDVFKSMLTRNAGDKSDWDVFWRP